MKTILGIDIGTSGTKTILVDDQGRVIAAKTLEYPMETPKPGWTQQHPQDWWAASVESIRTVLAKANVPAQDIAAIGLSGQMHGMVALDEHDQVVRPAILWNDQRTEKQCEEITEAAGGLEELLKLTNNRMLTGYTGYTFACRYGKAPDPVTYEFTGHTQFVAIVILAIVAILFAIIACVVSGAYKRSQKAVADQAAAAAAPVAEPISE